MNELQSKIIKVISDALEIDISRVDLSSTAEDFEEWDSLTQLSIMEGLVREFGEKIYEISNLAVCDSVVKFENELKNIL